jgi:hypothetical protein
MSSRRTSAAVATAVALVLIAAVVAIAASGGGGHTATNASSSSGATAASKPVGEVALAATYLGLSRSRLRSELRAGRTLAQIADSTSGKSAAGLIDALVSAKTARLTAAAASSQLTPAQRTARLTRLRAKVIAAVNRTRTAGAGPRGGGDLAAAATYLGVGRAELDRELSSGRTLAQVAAPRPGKSTAGLIEALVADRRARLAAQLAAGRINATLERAALATLQQRVTVAVNRPHKAHAKKSAAKTTSTQAGGGEGAEVEGAEGAEAPPAAAEG